MNRGGEPAKIALGLLKLTVPSWELCESMLGNPALSTITPPWKGRRSWAEYQAKSHITVKTNFSPWVGQFLTATMWLIARVGRFSSGSPPGVHLVGARSPGRRLRHRRHPHGGAALERSVVVVMAAHSSGCGGSALANVVRMCSSDRPSRRSTTNLLRRPTHRRGRQGRDRRGRRREGD